MVRSDIVVYDIRESARLIQEFVDAIDRDLGCDNC